MILIPEVRNRVVSTFLSKKQRARDVQKLDRLFAVLRPRSYEQKIPHGSSGDSLSQEEPQSLSLQIPNYDQLIPHLYPMNTRDPAIKTYQSQDIALKNLALSLLKIKILEHNISVYRRSIYDINNFDFNYLSKISPGTQSPPPSRNITLLVQDPNTYSLRVTPKTIPKLLIQFIKSNNLTGLANLSTWTGHVPSKVRSTLDHHTLLILLGELIRANSPWPQQLQLLEHIVNDRILNPMATHNDNDKRDGPIFKFLHTHAHTKHRRGRCDGKEKKWRRGVKGGGTS